MDLQQLRKEINEIDNEIIELFKKRMNCCFGVAEYKIENNLPVFQADREKEIIEHIHKLGKEMLAAQFIQRIFAKATYNKDAEAN